MSFYTSPYSTNNNQITDHGIWFSRFQFTRTAKCPICQNADLQESPKNWQKIYLVPKELGGRDIYPNLYPVCQSCAMLIGNQSVPGMLCQQGHISQTEADGMLAQFLQEFESHDPYCSHCTSYRKNYKTSLHGDKCWPCIEKGHVPMDTSPD